MSNVKTASRTQRIVVDPATYSISVVNAGPQGPAGGGGSGGTDLPVGGTTGQVLGKLSDSDHDVGWITITVSAAATEVRSDWDSPYSYIGVAPSGTLESASDWTISRIEVELDGSVTELHALSAVWNDRVTEVYS